MADNKIGDGLKKILLAGVGAVAITAEKGSEIIGELVKKGELTVEQGKELNKDLQRNFKDSMDKKESTSTRSVRRFPRCPRKNLPRSKSRSNRLKSSSKRR